MKKRVLSLMLASTLMLALAACGGNETGGAGNETGNPEASAPVDTEPSEDSVAPVIPGEPSEAPSEQPSEQPSEEPSAAPSAPVESAPVETPAPETSAPSANIDLSVFYAETYDALFPIDAEGNPTGPFTEDFAAVPEMLDGFFPGLSEIETKQCMALMPAMSGVPYEVVLIEVANAADVDAVKAILQARIDSQVSNQMNYPAVIENWELNSRIVVNGNYIMLAVCDVCDSFVASFNALFN